MEDNVQASMRASPRLAKALHKAFIIPPVILIALLCLWSASTVLPISMIVLQFRFSGQRLGFLCFPTSRTFCLEAPLISCTMKAREQQSLRIEQPEAETMPAFLSSKKLRKVIKEKKLMKERKARLKLNDHTSLGTLKAFTDGIEMSPSLEEKEEECVEVFEEFVTNKVLKKKGCAKSMKGDQNSWREDLEDESMVSDKALDNFYEDAECNQCNQNLESSTFDHANEDASLNMQEQGRYTEAYLLEANQNSNFLHINERAAFRDDRAESLDRKEAGEYTREAANIIENRQDEGQRRWKEQPAYDRLEEATSGRLRNATDYVTHVGNIKEKGDSPVQVANHSCYSITDNIGSKRENLILLKKQELEAINSTNKNDLGSVENDEGVNDSGRKEDFTSPDNGNDAAIMNSFRELNLATKEAMKVMEAIRETAMTHGTRAAGEAPRFQSQRDNARKDQCEKKRVYMYSLPSKFNTDLLQNCEQLIPWSNMCSSIQNSGMGKLIEDKQEEGGATLVPAERWYETHQYALEIIFHSRLKKYPCLTSRPEQADLFYIPYYAGLDVLRWHFLKNVTTSRKDKLGLELIEWLEGQKWWRRRQGEDHVLVLGKITYDFRRVNDKAKSWGSNLLNQPQMQKVTKLLIERQPWHENDVGIPHPTFFHPRSDSDIRVWQRHIHHAGREHLVSFAGLPRPGQPQNIRSVLISQCVQRPAACHYLPCINNICMRPKTTMSLFLHSHFCLQPPGDSPTRRSIFDSLIAGCIPVFFDPYSAYLQYPWHLPANTTQYSVYISPSHVTDSNVNVVDVLERVPPHVRDEMRMRIIYEIMPRLVYAESGSKLRETDDAFDISMRHLVWKMARKQSMN